MPITARGGALFHADSQAFFYCGATNEFWARFGQRILGVAMKPVEQVLRRSCPQDWSVQHSS